MNDLSSILRSLNFWRCLLAGTCSFFGTWILNRDIISYLTVADPVGRDIGFFLGTTVFYILLAFAARRHASVLHLRVLEAISAGAIVLGVAAFAVVSSQELPGLASVAFFVCELGDVMPGILFLVALCELDTKRGIALCVCFSYAIASVLQVGAAGIPGEIRMGLYPLLGIAVLALTHPLARDNFARLREGQRIGDYQISSPQSFLSPFNLLFVSLFVFQFVFGFALALNNQHGVPLDTSVVGVLACGIGLLIGLSRRDRGSEDALFQIAALFVIGGFLLALLSLFSTVGSLANVVLAMGTVCFSVLRILSITAVGIRNRLDAVYMAACSSAFQSTGTLVGADFGHWANQLDAAGTALIVAGVLFAFAVYCIVPMRRFSFEEAIYGVQPVADVAALPLSEASEQSKFDEVCHQLGERFGLTKREQEIMAMLARGRNGKFVEDYYVISYNTVKTHVKHIYLKLDVHSQQELIDLVEDSLPVSG